MKNKIILISLVLALPLSQRLNAQIILTNTDLPKIGDTQISIKVDSIEAINTLPGNTGENVFWDFSNLSGKNYDTLSWLNAASASSYSQFPLAALSLKKACTKVHSHVTHTDIETCKNDFYIKNNNGLLYYGSDVHNISVYDIPRNVFPLLQYGDSIKNESRLVYYSDGNIEKVLHVIGYSKADGWGIIKTPAGSASAIRIFTSETVIDSTYTNGVVTSLTKTEGNYYYKWYTKGLGYPVFQISKGTLNQSDKYQIAEYAAKLQSISTDIEQVSSNQISATIYPNPFNNRATLKFSSNASAENYTLSIFDIYGRIVFKSENNTGNEIIIQRNNMPQGSYFYNLANRNTTIKGKFIIVNNQ